MWVPITWGSQHLGSMAESLKCRLVLATFEVAGRGVFAASAV